MTAQERAQFADQSANQVQLIRSLNLQKKAANAIFKDQIEEATREMHRCAECTTTGIETREVTCFDRVNRYRGISETIRSDTGEVIATRHLTPKELQMSFDDLVLDSGTTTHEEDEENEEENESEIEEEANADEASTSDDSDN